MSKPLILLTGGTGHIGFKTLVTALEAGYRVRAAVRRESSIKDITSASSIKSHLANLTFIIVPDITAPGAFDPAAKDVEAIVHIASPLAIPSDDHEKTIIRPAVDGTLSMLESALISPSVKRVVITASIVSVMPLAAWGPGFDKIVNPNEAVPDMHGPYSSVMHAYASSKNQAYNASQRFMAERKPGFDLVSVMPGFVAGRNELAKTREAVNAGTNRLFLMPLLGIKNEEGLWTLTCHVDDVAKVHVGALDREVVKGGANLGVVYRGRDGGVVWDDALEIVRRRLPEAVESGVFPMGGMTRSNVMKFDASETERVLGIKFQDFEEQIVSVAQAYVEAKV
jgi:nucleoside-diphosphate-sugar epimerase